VNGYVHDIEHESLAGKELRLRQYQSLSLNPKRVYQNERDENNHSARECLGNNLGLRGYETLHDARSYLYLGLDVTYGREGVNNRRNPDVDGRGVGPIALQ
jgi:hypothetical protein